MHSLIRNLYDNVMVGGKYDQKVSMQIIHHALGLLSPERRKKLAERAEKRANSYKEEGYSK